MSDFVKDHVTRIFGDAGYELIEIYGDRGGIVQGDGLHLIVKPDISAAARRFSSDEAVISTIEQDAKDSAKIHFSLYGGSSSIDREGVYLSDEFINFLKDETSRIYYKAQRDVNAIFEAEDAPDREWNGRHYVGVVDEFAVDDAEGNRSFVRVTQIADRSFNPYEAGDEEADRAEAASIIDGKLAHGSIEVEIYDAPSNGEGGPFRILPEDEYDPEEFQPDDARNIVRGTGLIWGRDPDNAEILDLAAELVAEEEAFAVSEALKARAAERRLSAPAADTAETIASKP